MVYQAGLRSELEIATDEMEKAQQRLAGLEREKAILQGATSLAASSVSTAAPNKAVEESLRKELQNLVCSTHCDSYQHCPEHSEAFSPVCLLYL